MSQPQDIVARFLQEAQTALEEAQARLAALEAELAPTRTEVSRLEKIVTGLKGMQGQPAESPALPALAAEPAEPAPTPEPKEPPEPKVVRIRSKADGTPMTQIFSQKAPTKEEVRDWLTKRGPKEFTRREFGVAFGYPESGAHAVEHFLKPFIDEGIVKEKVVIRGASNKKYYTFQYVKPAPDPNWRPRPKGALEVEASYLSDAPEQNGQNRIEGKDFGQGAIPGTGSTGRMTSDKTLDGILRRVSNQVKVEKPQSGHLKVTCKRTGDSVTLPHTPHQHGAIYESAKQKLRDIGVQGI